MKSRAWHSLGGWGRAFMFRATHCNVVTNASEKSEYEQAVLQGETRASG